MTNATQHEQVIGRLRNGVAALARHVEATTRQVGAYLEPGTTTPSESENHQ